MRLTVSLTLLLFFTLGLQAQPIRFSGNVNDTTGKNPLPNALMMTLRFSDSSLVGYSRTDKYGNFKPYLAARDTYIVILSHPAHSDKTFLLVPSPNDTIFNFKNVQLPPKSVTIKEVEVLAYREKSYYKGDTLVFTADSFKTKANATVEDLLKRLPGFRVDVNGKISVQGKEVDQVLVDGDEFFGSDPTVATRNLGANTIKNVQVYDKKNETAQEGQEETVKVINLQMKEDAKRGYFGKVSGATDFQNFHENELLANRFKGHRKISVFGLMANTPKQAFNWNDVDRYGLSGEQQWTFDEESGNWTSNQDRRKGIPQTIKGGAYFNDRFGKSTKLNGDYTFNQNRLISGTETNTQFFLQDTSYINKTTVASESFNQNHGLNARFQTNLDSLTELHIQPRVKVNNSRNSREQTDDFIFDSVVTRRTILNNITESQARDFNTRFRIKRNFMKKDRMLSVQYQPVYNDYHADTRLNTEYNYFTTAQADSALNQTRRQENMRMEHNAEVQYVEPWTKKFRTEFNYNFGHNHNSTMRETFDLLPSGTDIFNPRMSNNFDNYRIIHRVGTKLVYDVKKFRTTAGVQARNITQTNHNLSTGQTLTLNVNNLLPNASFIYRFNQGSQFQLYYNSSSQLPDLQQMQPVIDNTDPNRISMGNPDLKPTWNNNFNVNYWFYKGITDINFWSGGNVTLIDNQISNTTDFDELGRAFTRPVNVDGNYYVNAWMGGGFPLFKRFMKMYISMNGNYNNNVSYVNGQQVLSTNTRVNPRVTLEKNSEKLEVRLEGGYEYNVPKTNISSRSQQPYYTYNLEGNFEVKITKRFFVTAEGNYINNGNRTPGYNLNYFILNGSLNYNFLKKENLMVSLLGNDILNQNISNERFINSNQIVDSKTEIIRRYFLLRVLFKFNSQQANPDPYED